MSRFFIDRPIFAWVIAIIIMMVGGIAIFRLPIAQYPSVAPPAISISVTYPGASAETVQSTVVAVIEQQLTGIDNLLYFSSESDKDGSMSITLNFEQGTDPDIAQVQVQNKVQLAQPRLPQVVQQQGIRVAKSASNFLDVIAFSSADGSMSSADISDFIASNIQDPLSRTQGIGDFQLFGAQYAMRIWLDPAKLDNFGLTTADISAAIRTQNVQLATGELGSLPARPGQQLNATIIGPSYLEKPEQFGQILLKVLSSGAQIRLKDVARIEFGGETYATSSKFNGKPAAGIGLRLASGANALQTQKNLEATLSRLQPSFPPGLEVHYPYNTAPFVKLSIRDVVKTLLESIILVFLVMYLFLQNLRATLVPTIAVPIVLLGSFGVLAAAGFSINTLTMFGMVLAIGLLVDDAIVVVENVERVMEEEGLPPKEATRKSMDQITGALVGIALVLTAVFLPMAFFGGSTGVIYRQFSITLVSAMGLSVLVAITFTPALCATLLKSPHQDDTRHQTGFFGWFNRSYNRLHDRYHAAVRNVVQRPKRYSFAYLIIVVALGILFVRLPTSFLPDEDQGVMFIQVSTPAGATSERTQQVLDQVSDYLQKQESHAVSSVFTINGFSFGGRGQSSGAGFVSFKDFEDRRGRRYSVQGVAERTTKFMATIKDAKAFAFAPPAVIELGNATGFDFELLDSGDIGHQRLLAARDQLLALAAKDPDLAGVRANGLDDEPQYKIEFDWQKAIAQGLSIADVNDVVGAAWGSSYVNDFLDRGRVKRVYIQGDAGSRMLPQDLAQWYVRNASGQMVPLSSFMTAAWSYGAPRLERFNGRPSFEILGSPAPGLSTGTAMNKMEQLVKQLPKGVGFDWTGLSYEERQSGSQTPALYSVSIVVVFLCLAALYESWSIPVAVILVVPLGVIGAVLATTVRGLSNDVFFQVGLLTTVGLSAKNAILIVEFAKENYDRTGDLLGAAVEAARERLRPILMTSMAFLLGVLPLAISTGAGSGGQNAIGTGVVGGMFSATVLAIFFVPIFFVVILRLFGIKARHRPTEDDTDGPPAHSETPSPSTPSSP